MISVVSVARYKIVCKTVNKMIFSNQVVLECTLCTAKPERFKLSVRAIDDFVSFALI
jgi:hypothetical protein